MQIFHPNLKLKVWEAGVKSKDLLINMKKTKFLVSGVGLDVLKESSNYPCALCCSGVGSNPIECLQCKLCAHKRWSGII